MNPYAVLGVKNDAEADEIKKKYRKLARETHPDLNPGDAAAETRFKEISVAYDILSDPEKRREFDEFGEISLSAGFDAERARADRGRFSERFGAGGGPRSGEAFEFGDLDDLLRRFGGGADFSARANLRRRGADIEATLQLDLPEAVRGGERKMSIDRRRADGSRFAETITVRVPPGISDGGRLRVPGKGGQGSGGGSDGDLWLHTRVRPHPIFHQKGRNLEFDLPLSIREAVLGAQIEVPTLDGPVVLTIPPGTSSHGRLRLRGKGVPASSGKPAGDLLARVKIIAPKDVDPELRERLEAFDQDDPRKGLWT